MSGLPSSRRRGQACPTSPSTDPPLSRASPLPQGIYGEHTSVVANDQPVGAGLLAKTAVHSTSMQTDPPLSRASPLPQGIYGEHTSVVANDQPVGAGLLAKTAARSHHHSLTHRYPNCVSTRSRPACLAAYTPESARSNKASAPSPARQVAMPKLAVTIPTSSIGAERKPSHSPRARA